MWHAAHGARRRVRLSRGATIKKTWLLKWRATPRIWLAADCYAFSGGTAAVVGLAPFTVKFQSSDLASGLGLCIGAKRVGRSG